MKHGWIILGLMVLLLASVGVLIYLWTQVPMGLPFDLLLWAFIFGIFALVVAIAWLAGWLSRKKALEPKPQSTLIETAKAEPSPLAGEIKTEPSPLAGEIKTEPSPLAGEIKTEPSPLAGEIKTEPSPLAGEIKTEPSQRPVKEIAGRGSKIIDIEGIGPVYAGKLNSIGIYTTSDLLEAGATPLGRQVLAEKTGISGKLILEWVNLADLFRIKGVGEEYSDLLEEAGVDTVVELAKRNAENLLVRIYEVNEKKKLVRRLPTLNEIKQWIAQAKTLPRKVEY
jgi:predicted flap endonuclease-1-like 5' DNA nuclease